MEAKTHTETQFRSRKLPLTRKIYTFYHAPIVKFWANTVGRVASRAQARARCLFIREELLVTEAVGAHLFCFQGGLRGHACGDVDGL